MTGTPKGIDLCFGDFRNQPDNVLAQVEQTMFGFHSLSASSTFESKYSSHAFFNNGDNVFGDHDQ